MATTMMDIGIATGFLHPGPAADKSRNRNYNQKKWAVGISKNWRPSSAIQCNLTVKEDSLEKLEKVNEGRSDGRRAALIGLIALSSRFLLPSNAAAHPVSEPHGENRNPYMVVARAGPESTIQQIQEFSPLGFLNDLGVYLSGVVGALYLLEKESKSSTISQLENAESRVKQVESETFLISQEQQNRLSEMKEQSLQDVAKVKEENVSLSMELQTTKTLVDTLSVQLTTQKDMVQTVEGKATKLQEAFREAEENYKSLQHNFINEQTRCEQQENELQLKKEKIILKEEKTSSLEAALKELEISSHKVSMELSSLQGELSEATKKIFDIEDEIPDLTRSLQVKGDNLEELTKQLSSAAAENEIIGQRTKTLKQEISDVQKFAAEDLLLATKIANSRQNEVESLSLKLSAKSKEVEEKTQVIDESLAEFETLRQSLADLKTKVIELNKLSAELDANTEQNEQLRKELEELKTSSATSISLLTKSLKAEEETRNKLGEELKETKSNLHDSSQAITMLKGRILEVSAANRKLQSEIEEALKAVDAATADLTKEKANVDDAQRQALATQEALQKESALVQNLQYEFSEAKRNMDELKEQLNSLSKDLEDANANSATIEAQNASLEERLSKEKEATTSLQENAIEDEASLEKLLQEKHVFVAKSQEMEERISLAETNMVKLKEQTSMMRTMVKSAGSRMEDIAKTYTDATSIINGIEARISNSAAKEYLQLQSQNLQEQVSGATDLMVQLTNLEGIVSELELKLDEVSPSYVPENVETMPNREKALISAS